VKMIVVVCWIAFVCGKNAIRENPTNLTPWWQ
jgi:hypothetical protein